MGDQISCMKVFIGWKKKVEVFAHRLCTVLLKFLKRLHRIALAALFQCVNGVTSLCLSLIRERPWARVGLWNNSGHRKFPES